jgi:hypothetical protein
MSAIDLQRGDQDFLWDIDLAELPHPFLASPKLSLGLSGAAAGLGDGVHARGGFPITVASSGHNK